VEKILFWRIRINGELKLNQKNKNSVIKFVNSLKLFGYGYSWGGFESLALYQDKREQGNRQYLKLANDEHLVRLHNWFRGSK